MTFKFKGYIFNLNQFLSSRVLFNDSKMFASEQSLFFVKLLKMKYFFPETFPQVQNPLLNN